MRLRATRLTAIAHPLRGLRLTDLAAAIRALFAAGEQGVWYDPSDLTTLFQDAAGTTPVTAVEQPVGLMLDKSKGLVLGPELVATPISVTGTGWSVSGNSVIASNAPVGGKVILANATDSTKKYKITFTSSNLSGATCYLRMDDLVSASQKRISSAKTYNFILNGGVYGAFLFFDVYEGPPFSVTLDNISVRELPGNHATQTTSTSRPVLSARVNLLTATETLATQTVNTRATTQTLRFEGAGTVTLSGAATGTYSAGSHSVTTTAGNLTLTVSGTVTKADLRAANDGVGLPAYQRVNTSTDYDTAGFPHYLRFDGVDDFLVTPTITPVTDKVQVFAGVRRLNSATSVIAEFSAFYVNSGAFGLFCEGTPGDANNYEFGSKGNILSKITASPFVAPITNVLTGIGDISGDSAILRVNGTQAASSTADQGTGNYLAYPLYIGRRGGTTLPFNGHLYSLIVRFAQSTDQQIIGAERYVNDKTRAYA